VLRVIEFRDVDLTDEPELREWYDVWAAAQAGRPREFVTPWPIARESMPRQHPGFSVILFTAHEEGIPVGGGLLNVPLQDNLSVVFGEVAAHPGHRRRGVGTAVLAELERRVGALGRSRPIIEVFTPADGVSAGQAFAEARGYTVANREGMKSIDLVASEPGWAALEADVSAAIGDHRVEVFRDELPEEHLEGFLAMLGRFMSEVPQGDLDLEDADWTPDRFRAAEQRRHDIGLAMITAVAFAPDGQIVGSNDVRVSRHDPRVGYIGITLVLPGHRGHRLGLATKLATHRDLRGSFPECRSVVTSNADVNEHMNAINHALGYRQRETLLEYHRSL
jgi:GNAT superfamily N-acetyltransferase